VLDGWEEGLDGIVSFADQQVQEITDFGEFYDEE
jgi:hypothetical protein